MSTLTTNRINTSNILKNQLFFVPLGIDNNADGLSDGWTLIKDTGITATATLELNAQKIDLTNSTSAGDAYIRYIVDCLPNDKVTVTFVAKVTVVSGTSRIRTRIDWYNGASYLSSSLNTTSSNTNFVTVSTGKLVAPANTTKAYIRIGVQAQAIGDKGTGWFKNGSVIVSTQ